MSRREKTQRPGKRCRIVYPALYYGMAHLNLTQDEVWLMPFGLLMDLWECHKQFMGIAKPKQVLTIDDVIPYGI